VALDETRYTLQLHHKSHKSTLAWSAKFECVFTVSLALRWKNSSGNVLSYRRRTVYESAQCTYVRTDGMSWAFE
jgi:hypothetical protein